MTSNLNSPNSRDSKLKREKDQDQSITQKGVCYRGFTSIDQEMEREIAMQWFKQMGKSKSLHGVLLVEDTSK